MVFATYSSLIGESQGQEKYNTRMSQLLNWCGHDFDGVVSFSGLLFVVPFIFYCRSSFSSLSDDLQAFPVFP